MYKNKTILLNFNIENIVEYLKAGNLLLFITQI